MAVDPKTREVVSDPEILNGDKSISILPYWGGFVAYLPCMHRGICEKDLRKLAAALILIADRVDELNRQYESGLIDNFPLPKERKFPI